MAADVKDAAKTLTPLVTATEPTPLTTAEDDAGSPGPPTVTALQPPTGLVSSAENAVQEVTDAEFAKTPGTKVAEEDTVKETSTKAEPAYSETTSESAPHPTESETVAQVDASQKGDGPTEDGEQTAESAKANARPVETRTSIPPPVSTEHPPTTSPATLDSLLSPTETEGKFSVRQSVASSDVTDDETRFSTVLLSARESLSTNPSPKIAVGHSVLGSVEEGPASDEITLVDDWRQHKKSASNSTILSTNNVPFLASRLNDANNGEPQSRPTSLSNKIREEFYQKTTAPSGQEPGLDGESAVDWDYQGYAAEQPEQLARAIELGIPKALRGMVWQLMSASKDPELENTYLRLLKETSPHEKAISRDLGRTFPHHAFFTDGHGIGQENLFNVLKAYSLYDPQVGYCQGLPFIVAILLLNMPDEEAFCLLVRLMHSYDLRGHFLPEMPKLQLRLFERLLEELLPVLHLHFVRQGIKASMYCSQWFLTMFSYRFPMEIVFRIYDKCLASGIEALFAFSMALLIKNEDTLLSMKFDQLLSFLNTRVFEVYQTSMPAQIGSHEGETETRYRVDEFVQDAMSLRITPFMLDSYAHEYEDLVRARDAHKLEMENLKNTNRQLGAQVKTLESNLAQLNTEHCQVLNELVMARLRHEELESELVRYKLLCVDRHPRSLVARRSCPPRYAEAMHQSEDAMSSHRISLVSKRGSSSTNG
ncbi:rab-GTPase-TBC domain-containing protein [Trametes elegans]|nr:rab-GTPase-TBC domain-containing protein [Trametes elegans]